MKYEGCRLGSLNSGTYNRITNLTPFFTPGAEGGRPFQTEKEKQEVKLIEKPVGVQKNRKKQKKGRVKKEKKGRKRVKKEKKEKKEKEGERRINVKKKEKEEKRVRLQPQNSKT